MIGTLNDWLASPVYWRGVELYEKYGDSAFLKVLFRSSEDDYNRQKLIEAIQQIADNAQTQEQQVVDNMPNSLRDSLHNARRLMDERSALKERIRVLYLQGKTDTEIKPLAFQILDLNDQIGEIYDQDRFYRQTGYLPEKVSLGETSVHALITRRNTLRTYISREKDAEKLKSYKKDLFSAVQKLKALGVTSKETDEKID